MTTTPTTAGKDNTPAPSPQKKHKRWWKILATIVVIVVLLVALAPMLLSTGPGRNFILRQINSRIPGKVLASGLSIGWFSPASVQGFELRDPDGKMVLAWNECATGTSIFGYLTRSRNNLGNITLSNIHGDIVVYPDGSTNLERTFVVRTPPTTSSPTSPATVSATAEPTASRTYTFTGSLDVQISRLTFTAPGEPPLAVENSTAKVRSTGEVADVDVTIELRSGSAAPTKVTATAKVANLRADHPTGTGHGQVSDLDLAALAPLLKAMNVQLTPTGMFNADLTFSSTSDAASLKGVPTITQFTLTGPALRGDTIRSASIKFPLDLQFKGGVIRVNDTGVVSDLLAMKFNGTTDLGDSAGKPIAFELSGTLDYDLAQLAAALPHWMPETLTVSGRRSMPLHIKGPLTAAAGLKRFLKLHVDATPGWDQAKYSGVEIGAANLPLLLDDGVLTITPTDMAANGGTFRAQGTVDLNQTPPAYILTKSEATHRIVSNVAINQEVAGGPLKFLPLIWGASGKDANLINVTGSANVDIAEAYFPLDFEVLKSRGTMSAVINIDKLHTEAPIYSQLTSTVGGLLQLTGLQKSSSMDGDIKNITVTLKDGKFTYQNFRLGSSVANLTFAGAVGLDDSLAMNITMGTVGVNVPIPIALGGTISKPQPAVSGAFAKDLGKNLQNLGKGLGDLFKKKDSQK